MHPEEDWTLHSTAEEGRLSGTDTKLPSRVYRFRGISDSATQLQTSTYGGVALFHHTSRCTWPHPVMPEPSTQKDEMDIFKYANTTCDHQGSTSRWRCHCRGSGSHKGMAEVPQTRDAIIGQFRVYTTIRVRRTSNGHVEADRRTVKTHGTVLDVQ
ncbi:hypothetical protein VTK26DRAFT_4769 [Humicola hyalothermophila]